jgi:hypothetical protein
MDFRFYPLRGGYSEWGEPFFHADKPVNVKILAGWNKIFAGYLCTANAPGYLAFAGKMV